MFALGIAALVEAVEKGFGMIAAQLSALGAQRTADRAVREKEAEAVAAGTYDEFVSGLSALVAKHGEYAVKRGVKVWLLEQLDEDAYALVETDEQGRYRDVLNGKVLWDPDAEKRRCLMSIDVECPDCGSGLFVLFGNDVGLCVPCAKAWPLIPAEAA